MNTLGMQLILSALTIGLIASLIYGVLYFFLIATERASQYLALIVGLFIPIFLIYSSNYQKEFIGHESFPFLTYCIPVSLIADLIHKKASGATNAFYCFVVMFLVSVSGVQIFSTVVRESTLFPTLPFYVFSDYPVVIYLLVSIQLFAAPLLFLLVKNSRLRPGMDKHLES